MGRRREDGGLEGPAGGAERAWPVGRPGQTPNCLALCTRREGLYSSHARAQAVSAPDTWQMPGLAWQAGTTRAVEMVCVHVIFVVDR